MALKRSELSGVFVRRKAARHEGLGWWQLAVRLCQQVLLLLVPWRAAGLARVDLEPPEPPATAAASDRPQGGRGGRVRLQRRQRCPGRGSGEPRVALGSPGCRRPCHGALEPQSGLLGQDLLRPRLMAAVPVQMAITEQAPGSSLQNSFTLTSLPDTHITSFPNRSL